MALIIETNEINFYEKPDFKFSNLNRKAIDILNEPIVVQTGQPIVLGYILLLKLMTQHYHSPGLISAWS